MGGSRGTHVINVIKRLGSISGNFGGKGLLRVKNLTLGIKPPVKPEISAKFRRNSKYTYVFVSPNMHQYPVHFVAPSNYDENVMDNVVKSRF